MNGFLRGHRVLAVKKEFVPDGENSFWTFCVEYLDGTPPGVASPGGRLPKVDYKEVLKPEEFEVFSRLREWRKAVAEKEGVPVYVVLSNEQLAQTVRKRVSAYPARPRIPTGFHHSARRCEGRATPGAVATALQP